MTVQTGAALTARRMTVVGIVQGVGFRPFVYGLARRHGLGGWVLNTASGVEIVLVGSDAALDAFAADLPETAPPLAVLDRITVESIPLPGRAVVDQRRGVAAVPHPRLRGRTG